MTPQQRYNRSPRGRQKVLETKARYRQSEKGKAVEHAYKEAYRDREKELARKRSKLSHNLTKQAERQRLRRAALIPRMHAGHRDEIAALYEDARLMGLTVDHIIPLYGKTVWGLHAPQNLQLLTLQDNSSKADRLP